MQFWNELEGRNIDGRHPLRRLVRSEGRTAWFETEAGDPISTPATISLVEALTDADEVTERLKAAQSLSHENLVSITKIGQVSFDNTLFVYAVMGHIEQSLSDVLQGQALTPEEGREVAEALVGALTAIHQKGLSHGHVEAASVLATEQAVKLRSDCLQISPAGQADDVAGIGATLFHAFTQRKALSATDAQINRIPAPFAEIVRNSFARRWTLAQVANALKPGQPAAHAAPAAAVAPPSAPAPVPAPTPAPAVAAPVAVKEEKAPAPAKASAPRPTPAPTPALGAAAPPAPAPVPPAPAAKPPAPAPKAPAPPVVLAPSAAPAARLEPLPPQTESYEAEPEDLYDGGAKRRPLALYGVIALVVLAVLGWLLWKPHAAPTPAGEPAAQTAAASPAEPPAPAAPSPSPAARSGASTAAATTPGNDRTVWRVVAYTYKRPEAAAKMVETLKTKHPNLNVSVFSPAQRKSDYLVSLGGAMSRDQAMKMRDKALRMGLPADTYVRNFSE